METLENEIEDIDKKLEALAEEETESNPIVNAVIVQAANLMGIHRGGTKLCDKSKARKSNIAEPGDLSVSDSSNASDIEKSNGRKDVDNVLMRSLPVVRVGKKIMMRSIVMMFLIKIVLYSSSTQTLCVSNLLQKSLASAWHKG